MTIDGESTTFSKETALGLAAQCDEDDKRATPGEWFGDDRGWITAPILGDDRSGAEHEVLTLGEHSRREDIAVAARSRNNLAAIAQTLRAAVEEVERQRSLIAQLDEHRITRNAENSSLLAEREQLRGEVARMEKHVAHNDEEYRTMKDVLRAEHEECKRLRGEVEKMRPVYEAAVGWFKATHTGDANCSAGDCDDCDARTQEGVLRVRIARSLGEQPDWWDMRKAGLASLPSDEGSGE